MSKELYEAIDNLWTNLAHSEYTENYSIKDRNLLIKAVERLEEIDNANSSEALECLHTIAFNTQFIAGMNFGNELRTIEQIIIKSQEQEKVLEIIFKKNVSIFWLKGSKTVEAYNYAIDLGDNEYRKLTQEEFELLKR